MKVKFLNLPFYTVLLVFLACTDIYLINGIKLTFVFVIPLIWVIMNKKLTVNNTNIWLLLWFVSYFFSIDHILSVKDFFIVTLGQIVLFVIYIYFSNNNIEKNAMIDHIFQISLYIVVYIGLLQLILFYVIGSQWGISHTNHGVGLPRVSSLCLEPDWYGVICMLAFIFMLMNIVTKTKFFNYVFDYLTLIASGLSLLLSLTRAAWLGALGAVFFVFMFYSNKVVKRRIIKLICWLIPIIVLTCIFLYLSDNPIFTKLLLRLDFTRWMSNDGGAAGSRSASIDIMMKYFKQHPFTGNGVGGMGLISSDRSLLLSLGYDYQINAGRGNANIFVTNLFDVGIFGTCFLVIFFVEIIRKSYSCFKINKDPLIITYLLLFISLLIDFQFNNGLRQVYFWIILGILSSYQKGKTKNQKNSLLSL